MRDLDLNDDIINVSDITDRVDELESLKDDAESATSEYEEALSELQQAESDADKHEAQQDVDAALAALKRAQDDFSDLEQDELGTLKDILEELRGNGGDHKWKGEWYPSHLIREDHFPDYAEELCKDIGDLPKNIPSYLVIDWKKTADNLLVDYSEVEIDGTTYYYR